MLSNLTKKFIASPNILYKSFSARAVEGIVSLFLMFRFIYQLIDVWI